jgi:hypothetical protein
VSPYAKLHVIINSGLYFYHYCVCIYLRVLYQLLKINVTYSTLLVEVLDPFRPCQVSVLPSVPNFCDIVLFGFVQTIIKQRG